MLLYNKTIFQVIRSVKTNSYILAINSQGLDPSLSELYFTSTKYFYKLKTHPLNVSLRNVILSVFVQIVLCLPATVSMLTVNIEFVLEYADRSNDEITCRYENKTE